jgi:predicted NUDIX family phosphoesterase
MGKLAGSESVLCVSAAEYETIARVRGFLPESLAPGPLPLALLLLVARSTFRPRTEALEHDPSWKQLIPYGVLWHGGRVLVYRRRSEGGDPRLRRRVSLGVGGHVEPRDQPDEDRDQEGVLSALFGRCLRRELHEELGVEPSSVRLAGLLDDASDDVGSVHVGVIFSVEVDSPEVQPREVDPLGWYEPARLRDDPELEWEGWSRILIDAGLEGMAVRPR